MEMSRESVSQKTRVSSQIHVLLPQSINLESFCAFIAAIFGVYQVTALPITANNCP
jgi:hypothetical protein